MSKILYIAICEVFETCPSSEGLPWFQGSPGLNWVITSGIHTIRFFCLFLFLFCFLPSGDDWPPEIEDSVYAILGCSVVCSVLVTCTDA